MELDTGSANSGTPASQYNPAMIEKGSENKDIPEKVETQQETPESAAAEKPADEQADEPEKKPEITEVERLRRQMQRGIDRRTRQLAETRAELQRLREEREDRLQTGENRVLSDASSTEERLTLTKADAERLIEERAKQLAPTIAEQLTSEEQVRSAALSLKKELGEEEFSEITDDLAAIFPRDKQLGLLSAKNKAALARYFADPENHDEAVALSRKSAIQFGYALAALDAKITAEKAAPKESKRPVPFDKVKGGGPVKTSIFELSDDEYAKARRKQLGRA